MIEVFTQHAVDTAEKAFREQTPIEIFGVFYLVESIKLRYGGRTLAGAPSFMRADVELTPCPPGAMQARSAV